MKKFVLATALSVTSIYANAADVTLENFARAETDNYIRTNMAAFNASVGQVIHMREPVTAENQTVIRQNQDTIYSAVVVDLSEPVQITLPETGGRYQSMHVINQDHYMYVKSLPGTYELTEEEVGTRFAMVNFRTFVNPNDPEDISAAHAAQDGIQASGGSKGPFEAPDWNREDLTKARQALSDLAELGMSSRYAFGREDEVRPVDFLVGVAAGWGGLPAVAAMYLIESVDKNDGKTPHLVEVSEVPVGAFWSVTVYTDEGYFSVNDLGINSYNNITAQRNDNGSYTLHFGDCNDGRVNCIPITEGWSYTVRLYEPSEEIIDGTWNFPRPVPVQ